MHYVYIKDNVVRDQCQIDPFSVFNAPYAEKFIEAPDEVTFNWSLVDGQWIEPPAPDYKLINKQQAEFLLQATDWTENQSVRNTAKTPHLVNGDAFDDYRVALRVIAVNPPETQVTDWPVKPDEQWSTQ